MFELQLHMYTKTLMLLFSLKKIFLGEHDQPIIDHIYLLNYSVSTLI